MSVVYIPQAVDERVMTVIREVDEPFHCGGCGFATTARVVSRGVQIDGAPSGRDHYTSVQYGYDFALAMATERARQILRDAACPRCGARRPPEPAAPAMQRSGGRKRWIRLGVAAFAAASVVLVSQALGAELAIRKGDAALVSVGAVVLAAMFVLAMELGSWRQPLASPVPSFLGYVDFYPTEPPRPPAWTCTRRMVYR